MRMWRRGPVRNAALAGLRSITVYTDTGWLRGSFGLLRERTTIASGETIDVNARGEVLRWALFHQPSGYHVANCANSLVAGLLVDDLEQFADRYPQVCRYSSVDDEVVRLIAPTMAKWASEGAIVLTVKERAAALAVWGVAA